LDSGRDEVCLCLLKKDIIFLQLYVQWNLWYRSSVATLSSTLTSYAILMKLLFENYMKYFIQEGKVTSNEELWQQRKRREEKDKKLE
jgi:hypothetical protein